MDNCIHPHKDYPVVVLGLCVPCVGAHPEVLDGGLKVPLESLASPEQCPTHAVLKQTSTRLQRLF
ncbi:hypothetical protein DPMN_031699 [Dreissena polymorpha]|uniref:Uncharacterized protein n=1 Tax=Dreissena polymorpha TaxID=45954 RepID=A0A9D4M0H3_DREPO|nr:hypothetical protein DPMN_031699 [Dreissena polymorpha]